MSEPMQGIRILEVAQFTFVPAAGGVLADWGADVIKIEHPIYGDAQRGLSTSGVGTDAGGVDFLMQQPNRGKRSVGLDLSKPDGLELLYRLAEQSDVFLTNFLPDARQRLKIDVEHIRARNPQIIYARGHGQGTDGPEAAIGGYDMTSFWCRSGCAAGTTRPEAPEPTGMPAAAFGDNIGGMTIAGGISAALFQRERTGEPSVIDISLFGTGCWAMGANIVASALMPEDTADLPRAGRASPFNPLVNSYRTKDGRWLALVFLQPDRYWKEFCERMGRAELIDDPRFRDYEVRAENSAACVSELDASFASRTLADWRKAFDGMEGPWAPHQTPREIHDDRQALANGYLQEVDGGERGRFRLVRSPVQFDGDRPQLTRGPEHGEHTDEVLLALGLSMDELLERKASGAVL